MLGYIFNITNLCRLFFYTPIIFLTGISGSIIYDYITYDKKKYDDDNKKKFKLMI